jgi:hypothetical protein
VNTKNKLTSSSIDSATSPPRKLKLLSLNNMSKAQIEEKLNTVREEGLFDGGYIDILLQSNDGEESADATAIKVIKEIEKRYAEDQEN